MPCTGLLLFLATCIGAISAVGVRAAQNRKEAMKPWPTKASFLRQLHSLSRDGVATNAYIFDIGANDGSWAQALYALCHENYRARLIPIIVEPQPRFYKELRSFAQRHNGHFFGAAAWAAEGANLTLHVNAADSRATGIRGGGAASPARGGSTIEVPTVSLSALIRSTLGGAPDGTLSYLHLDVEGAEFQLLPTLLLSGALCLLTHIHVEWHFPTLASAAWNASARDTAAGVGLRMAFEQLLQQGCASSVSSGRFEGREPGDPAVLTTMVDHEDSAGKEAVYRIARYATWQAFGSPRARPA